MSAAEPGAVPPPPNPFEPANPFDPPTDPDLTPVREPVGTSVVEQPAGRRSGLVPVALIFGFGSLVAIGLGAYGRAHEPTFVALNVAGFSSGTAAKAWLATVAFLLALVQLGSALVMYGRVPRIAAPPGSVPCTAGPGRVAVLVTVPVAVHCLYALGFQTGSVRVLVHSLVGCFFYGAFVAKMLILNRRDAPGWTLPVLGGAVFTGLVALWSTSAAWFFGTSGMTF